MVGGFLSTHSSADDLDKDGEKEDWDMGTFTPPPHIQYKYKLYKCNNTAHVCIQCVIPIYYS